MLGLARLLSRDQRPDPGLTTAQRRFFAENGYLILPGFFSSADVARLKAHFDTLWDRRANNPNVVIDSYFGRENAERSHFSAAAAEVRQFPYKLLDLHLDDDVIRDICTAPALMRAVGALLGANPLVCNSLLFERGSQQEAHFDTFFMPSTTPNMMAASWIAIDDVTETNGPLYYYPKSHLIPPYRFSHGKINAVFSELADGAARHIARIIDEHRLQQERFLPRAGDVLIWHAQLLHGGSPILDPAATRCSLVTHYWTDIDFPDPAQRLDFGGGRWVLKRAPQCVVDKTSLAEVDAFLATISVSDDLREAVPASFDPRMYLARNQDILRAGANPWQHYRDHGRNEGRIW